MRGGNSTVMRSHKPHLSPTLRGNFGKDSEQGRTLNENNWPKYPMQKLCFLNMFLKLLPYLSTELLD